MVDRPLVYVCPTCGWVAEVPAPPESCPRCESPVVDLNDADDATQTAACLAMFDAGEIERCGLGGQGAQPGP